MKCPATPCQLQTDHAGEHVAEYPTHRTTWPRDYGALSNNPICGYCHRHWSVCICDSLVDDS